jgi:hypothetical protein
MVKHLIQNGPSLNPSWVLANITELSHGLPQSFQNKAIVQCWGVLDPSDHQLHRVMH